MRELRYDGDGGVAWADAPDPEVPDDGALVRPLAVARCDLDPSMVAFGLFPGPFPVGHEAVAEVVEVGADVRHVQVGSRVVVPFQVSCGACDACRTGRTPACRVHRARAGAAFGFGPAGGGHGGAVADLLAVPHADHLLLEVPAGIDDTTACLLPDNVVDGYRAVAAGLARFPGADVLVLGGLAASIGLYAVLAARAFGAGSVRYVDEDEQRRDVAAELGAEVERPDGWPRRYDRAAVVVENTGTPDGLACALRSTDDLGRCTSVAIHFGETTPVPLLEAYTRGLTWHTSRADSRGLLPEVLAHVVDGTLDPTRVPVTEHAWDDAADVWLEPATKLVLRR